MTILNVLRSRQSIKVVGDLTARIQVRFSEISHQNFIINCIIFLIF